MLQNPVRYINLLVVVVVVVVHYRKYLKLITDRRDKGYYLPVLWQ